MARAASGDRLARPGRSPTPIRSPFCCSAVPSVTAPASIAGVAIEAGSVRARRRAESFVQVAGSALAKQAGPRDLTWLVASAPADEASAAKVAGQATSLVSAGRRVAIADIASGDATGASVPLVEALRNKRLFTRLASYAGGPAPASLASSLMEGLLRVGVATRTPPPDAALQSRLDDAQIIAVLRHLVVDFVYQAMIRPQAVTTTWRRTRWIRRHSMPIRRRGSKPT